MGKMTSTTIPQEDGRPELGIVKHEGKEYAAWGSVVTADHAIAYKSGDRMTTWAGADLGPCKVVASWPIYSFVSDRMYQVEATIEGVVYTGRTCGDSMIWKGKRKAQQASQ